MAKRALSKKENVTTGKNSSKKPLVSGPPSRPCRGSLVVHVRIGPAEVGAYGVLRRRGWPRHFCDGWRACRGNACRLPLPPKSACVGGPAVFPMATNEEDWTTWPHEHDDPAGSAVVYGIGVHPWWADAVKSGWEQRLREALTARPGCLVGEPPHPPPSLSPPAEPGLSCR